MVDEKASTTLGVYLPLFTAFLPKTVLYPCLLPVAQYHADGQYAACLHPEESRSAVLLFFMQVKL